VRGGERLLAGKDEGRSESGPRPSQKLGQWSRENRARPPETLRCSLCPS